MTPTMSDWLATLVPDWDPKLKKVYYLPDLDCTVVSDRYRLVSVRGRHSTTDADEVIRKYLGKVLDKFFMAVSDTTVEQIKTWCGPVEVPKESPCTECGGTGRCECPRCDDDHDCGDCDGTGKTIKFPETAPGIIAGLAVCRNRLGGVLVPFAGPCRVSTAPDMLRLDGADWTVMQATTNADTEGAPVFGKEVSS